MGITKILPRSIEFLINFKKFLQDIAGASILKEWKEIEKENIVFVDDSMLPEILRIQDEGFQNANKEKIFKYSKMFRKIFYVIKCKGKIAGFCIYYIKPSISLKGLRKQAVISSIAIDKKFRGKGLAEKLLNDTIKEIKLNGIQTITLYVNVNNVPAIKLYQKIGFQTTREVKNVCGEEEKCYEMELNLA